MASSKNRSHKRTWKNLLINKRYQLRFTLFLVGLSGVLMMLLGWWVMTVAGRATTLAINNTLTACQDLPGAPREGRAADSRPDALPPGIEPAAAPAPTPPSPAALPSGEATDSPRPRPVVTIDDSGMRELPPPASAERSDGEGAQSYERCRAAVPGKVKRLENRQRFIFSLLLAAGGFLTLGLLAYGIKMTHRVAGPLHKVSLYMAKLESGVYDPVYDLRKGDRLVEFYEHFRKAHAGMRILEEQDIAALRAVLAGAERDQLSSRSPELAEAVRELRAVLERKEKALA